MAVLHDFYFPTEGFVESFYINSLFLSRTRASDCRSDDRVLLAIVPDRARGPGYIRGFSGSEYRRIYAYQLR